MANTNACVHTATTISENAPVKELCSPSTCEEVSLNLTVDEGEYELRSANVETIIREPVFVFCHVSVQGNAQAMLTKTQEGNTISKT